MKFIIFDLDDTLLCGDCEREWINFLFSKGLLENPETILNKFDLEYRKGVLNFTEYSSFIQKPIKGFSKEKVGIFVDEFIKKHIKNLTDNLTKELLDEAKLADKVLIASGSHDFLVRAIGNFLGINSIIGTPVGIKDDIFSGKLSGEPTFAEGKVRAVEKWCSQNNQKIEESVFYSDSINDLPMFEACGLPIVVDPDEKLKKISKERSYKIINR